jgi:hypothetical protein
LKNAGARPADWDKPFEYGLDRSLDAVKYAGTSGSISPSSSGPPRATLFHSTLEAVMTLQRV